MSEYPFSFETPEQEEPMVDFRAMMKNPPPTDIVELRRLFGKLPMVTAHLRADVVEMRHLLEKTQNRPPGDGTVSARRWYALKEVVDAWDFVIGATEAFNRPEGELPDVPIATQVFNPAGPDDDIPF